MGINDTYERNMVDDKMTKKRINAYDVYQYLKTESPGHASKFAKIMQKKHPRIYKKELEPYVGGK